MKFSLGFRVRIEFDLIRFWTVLMPVALFWRVSYHYYCDLFCFDFLSIGIGMGWACLVVTTFSSCLRVVIVSELDFATWFVQQLLWRWPTINMLLLSENTMRRTTTNKSLLSATHSINFIWKTNICSSVRSCFKPGIEIEIVTANAHTQHIDLVNGNWHTSSLANNIRLQNYTSSESKHLGANDIFRLIWSPKINFNFRFSRAILEISSGVTFTCFIHMLFTV